jgi:sugar (pentulose or hexulose) kinase
MRIVCVDAGSSSIKAALFDDDRRVGPIVRTEVATRFDGPAVEIDADRFYDAFIRAVRLLGPAAAAADCLSYDVLAPGFVAVTRRGEALSPIITHQDRRSVAQALEIERRVGAERHLEILGCRPFPGGIASSSLLWLKENRPDAFKKADRFGLLNAFLNLRLTGNYVLDPGNATFLGFFNTGRLQGWSRELCSAVGVKPERLPEIRFGNEPAGALLPGPAAALGLRPGVPVLTGVIDTTASILSTGAAVGRVFNSIGSTDVLAILTDRFAPHPKVLTRAFGVGRLWVAVNTIAAGGAALNWVRRNLFADKSADEFFALVRELAGRSDAGPVKFRPYLAGDRLSIRQKTGAFANLTLATTREDMLKAVLVSWADLNARSLRRLRSRARPLPDVYVSGGSDDVASLLHSRWPGRWRFHYIEEAGLSGLAKMAGGRRPSAVGGRQSTEHSG